LNEVPHTPNATKLPPFLRDRLEDQRAAASIARQGFSRNEVIILRETRADGIIGWITEIRKVEVAFCEVLKVPHKYCKECCRGGSHFGSGGRKLLIEEFDVVQELRKMGVRRVLYDWIEQQARLHEIDEIWLRVNPGSEGFWQKMGFNPHSDIKPSDYACKQLEI
jgi:GNAT superfamily N-acetyltransferase